MPSPGKPNILVFFCDQLRRDILSFYGGGIVRTPHLDALAAESCVFDNAHTPTALCSPARASLMTGMYPHAHHMFNNSSPRYSYCQHLRPGVDMLQDWAAERGEYETAYFGKWHIGPVQDLFDSRFDHTPAGRTGLPGYAQTSSHWHPTTASLGPFAEEVYARAGTVAAPMEAFPDVLAADLTCDFLRQRDAARPFLAFCAFPGPHSPWLVPESFGIRYDPADIPLWPNFRDPMASKPFNQRKLQLLGADKFPDEEGMRKLLACQFSYMELIDQQVGKVMGALAEAGLADDTAVVFTADHGDMAGAHGFLSKGAYMYDEIYRIPMTVKLPGRRPPRRVPGLAHLMDLTATFLHLMSGEPQTRMGANELHGESLVPYLESAAPWERKVNYCEYHGDWYGHCSSRMVTDGDWKLVLNLSDTCELYDLRNDPGEMDNLFYREEAKETRDKLFQTLLEESRRLKDGQVRNYTPEIEDALAK